MTNTERIADIYKMLGEGKAMDAFEKYYHQDVVMEEIGEAKRVGKDANREYEIKFFSMVKEVHGGGVDAITSDDANNVTMVENWMEVTFQDGNRIRMEQVAVQRWKDGLIIHVKFYHK